MTHLDILYALQLTTTIWGMCLTPIYECPYAFTAFAIGWLYAFLNLADIDSSNYLLWRLPDIMDSTQDYLTIFFMTFEFIRLSSKDSNAHLILCLPLAIEIFALIMYPDALPSDQLFVYMKRGNWMIHTMFIYNLAVLEENPWLFAVWITSTLFCIDILIELSEDNQMLVKGYIYLVFYGVCTMAIYDDSYMELWNWFEKYL